MNVFRGIYTYCFFILVVSITVGCGDGQDQLESSIMGAVKQQCSATNSKISNVTSKLTVSQLEQACHSSQNYKCSAKIFSPIINNGKTFSKECTEYAPLNRPCLSLDIDTFNTSKIMEQIKDPKSFEPGGDFNRSDYVCYNSNIETNGEIAGQGSNLDEALDEAFVKCLNVKGVVTND